MNPFILKRFALLLLLCTGFFFLGNNLVQLTDPDEVFYSLTAVEMEHNSQWSTPYIFDHPQFEKPILTYWLIKASFLIFGETPFAARFFPALFATFGILTVYSLGLVGFFNERRAFLAACILSTSAFYVGMGKTVFTDMIFSVFILYALLSFYIAYTSKDLKILGFLTFFIFSAFAVLTKGPLGFIIPALVVVTFLLYTRQLSFLRSIWVLIGFILFLVIALPWYVSMGMQYGRTFIYEFFYNDHWRRFLEAEHKTNDTWYFYFLTMISGVFPWSLLLVAAFVDLFKRLKFSVKPFEYFLLSWILVVFIIFQVSHSKLASYILPLFPALALLTANFIDEHLEGFQQDVIKKLSFILAGSLVLLGIGPLILFKIYASYVDSMIPAYFLSAGLWVVAGIGTTLLLKDRVREALGVLSLALVPFFITALLIRYDIEPYVSIHEAASYVPVISTEKATILTTRAYARGVRYHTHQNVAVLDMGGGNYFSPHPIPIIGAKDKLLTFLLEQKQTYAIVKKSYYEYIKNNFSEQFNINVLKISGINYVLKIQRI